MPDPYKAQQGGPNPVVALLVVGLLASVSALFVAFGGFGLFARPGVSAASSSSGSASLDASNGGLDADAGQGAPGGRGGQYDGPTPPAEDTAPEGDQPGGTDADAGIFDGGTLLVGSYAVPGDDVASSGLEAMQQRVAAAVPSFERADQPAQPVYEIAVSVASDEPGADGDYSADVPRAVVQAYLDAAREDDAIVLLDLQPGRVPFSSAARTWSWALQQPDVGLALDPRWRVRAGEVPGQDSGYVAAPELNRTMTWLDRLRRGNDLPQKLIVLHQSRPSLVRDLDSVKVPGGLAAVQLVDASGTPAEKTAAFDAVATPDTFTMGFKTFEDRDDPLMSGTEVHELRPKVRFVSTQ